MMDLKEILCCCCMETRQQIRLNSIYNLSVQNYSESYSYKVISYDKIFLVNVGHQDALPDALFVEIEDSCNLKSS
jgi:hypothetical protein